MDTTAGYRAMWEAWRDGDYELCAARADDLIGWLTLGGAPPATFSREGAMDDARAFLRRALAKVRVPADR